MNGSTNGDQFGYSIAFNEDGSKIVVGAPKNDNGGSDAGQVRTFEWNGTVWMPSGSDKWLLPPVVLVKHLTLVKTGTP